MSTVVDGEATDVTPAPQRYPKVVMNRRSRCAAVVSSEHVIDTAGVEMDAYQVISERLARSRVEHEVKAVRMMLDVFGHLGEVRFTGGG